MVSLSLSICSAVLSSVFVLQWCSKTDKNSFVFLHRNLHSLSYCAHKHIATEITRFLMRDEGVLVIVYKACFYFGVCKIVICLLGWSLLCFLHLLTVFINIQKVLFLLKLPSIVPVFIYYYE